MGSYTVWPLKSGFFHFTWTSQVALVVKDLPANSGDTGDSGSIPGSGRSPGGIGACGDFPGGSDGKSVCLQCGRPGFNSCVGKIF